MVAYTPARSRASPRESSPPPAPSRPESWKEVGMRLLLEMTSDGDIINDGEIYALFPFDPEALTCDPIE